MSSSAALVHEHQDGHATVADERGGRPPGPGGHDGHGSDSVHEHTGHTAHFRRLFWISLVLAVPAVVFSEMVQRWFHYSIPDFRGAFLVGPVFGSIVFWVGGWPFLKGGLEEL